MKTTKKTAFLWTLAALSMGCAACGSTVAYDGESCDWTVPKCNDDGTALLTCADGKTAVKKCACKDGKCEETPSACDWTGSKCSDDGKELLTCENGAISRKTCNCKDGKCEETPVETCDWSTPKCSDDGKQLLTCEKGAIVPKTCDCRNGACAETEEDECSWTGSKCTSDGDALITCADGKITDFQTCTCENDACQECDYDGKSCSSDAKYVVSCDKMTGTEYEIEQCIGKCQDGKCGDVACPAADSKSCLDAQTRIYCNAGVMTKAACEDNEICAEGECVAREAEETCDFQKRCIGDKTGYQECIGGKVKYTPCDNGYYCDAENSEISCKKAETCANFRAYCFEKDGKHYAMMCNENAASTSVPYEKSCAGVCQDGQCTSNKTYGATCNPSGQWTHDTCIGNDIARCIKRSSGDYEVVKPYDEDCAASGEICGIENIDGVLDPKCYEPCSEYGQIVNSCSDNGSGIKAVTRWKCDFIDASLGDRRLGYVYDDSEGSAYKICDIDCKEGKCIDYTTLTPDAGQACDADKFTQRCDSDRHAVTCDEQTVYDDSGNETSKYVVTVEYCDYDEQCYLKDGAASCKTVCSQGDPDKYECKNFLMNEVSYKYACKAYGNAYVYDYAGEEIADYMTACKNGCNASTGKCN